MAGAQIVECPGAVRSRNRRALASIEAAVDIGVKANGPAGEPFVARIALAVAVVIIELHARRKAKQKVAEVDTTHRGASIDDDALRA